MTLKFDVRRPSNSEILAAFTSNYETLAKTGKQTMVKIAEIAKQRGRLAIRAGGPGFNGRWPNALRADVYPKTKNSANAAALLYIRSTYAGIFEDGGRISEGKGSMLWIPLPDTPKRVSGKKVTPKLLSQAIGRPLTYYAAPGKKPMLVAFIRSAPNANRSVSISNLRRGLDTKGKNKVSKMVPLFIGLRAVTIPKKWNVRGAVIQAVTQIPAIYAEMLRRNRG